jgi:hypothetical protein
MRNSVELQILDQMVQAQAMMFRGMKVWADCRAAVPAAVACLIQQQVAERLLAMTREEIVVLSPHVLIRCSKLPSIWIVRQEACLTGSKGAGANKNRWQRRRPWSVAAGAASRLSPHGRIVSIQVHRWFVARSFRSPIETPFVTTHPKMKEIALR